MTDAIDPFKIRAHVPDFEQLSNEYRQLSDRARHRWRSRLDIAYGRGSTERLDVFFPDGPCRGLPIHLFIHGGYWRSGAKEEYAFIADTVCSSGAILALVEYSLLPQSRMKALMDQIRRAALWLYENGEAMGADVSNMSASGHSAGAHLASYLVLQSSFESKAESAPIGSLLLVSGIYDLAPLAASFLQPEIQLTAQEISDWSPISAVATTALNVTQLVGARETEPFHAQAAAFQCHLLNQSAAAHLITIESVDHMSIVRDLGIPGSATASHLLDCIRKPTRR